MKNTAPTPPPATTPATVGTATWPRRFAVRRTEIASPRCSAVEIRVTQAMVAGWPIPIAKPEIAMISSSSQKFVTVAIARHDSRVTIEPPLSTHFMPKRLVIWPSTKRTPMDESERTASSTPTSVVVKPSSRPSSGKKMSTTSMTAVIAEATKIADLKFGKPSTWRTLPLVLPAT